MAKRNSLILSRYQEIVDKKNIYSNDFDQGVVLVKYLEK